jgi:hypothetical protein
MAVNVLLWEIPNINLIKKEYSSCRMALYADENLKVSFEFNQWHRRNYGWGCILWKSIWYSHC